MKITPKIALEPTSGHWLDFLAFWSDTKKKHDFVDAFMEAQKSEKLDRGAAKRVIWGHEAGPSIAFLRIRAFWGGLARDLDLEARNKKLG